MSLANCMQGSVQKKATQCTLFRCESSELYVPGPTLVLAKLFPVFGQPFYGSYPCDLITGPTLELAVKYSRCGFHPTAVEAYAQKGDVHISGWVHRDAGLNTGLHRLFARC